ncbi:Kiwa anti-phage protein KwaB-like domain-containing protein [Halococcoides cellulosivorans]|uniref:DUF4868 domain-containing protein n=1 Tax=Halococcoides cellulosivorans TaxID=1679096 RepID=A0A2R4X3S9_9EURY|nr:Kiwa anti-phage protein KwaB-like domain-containing protein [Halococcoides cellulosivorans]AWB28452.1 hypothetical protein HARCEL1_12450 [Halococcoides cellulosivorans]
MSSASRSDARDQFDRLVDFLRRIEIVDTNELGIDLLLARLDEGSVEDYDYKFERISLDQEIPEELEGLFREKVESKRSALENESIRFSEYSLENRDRDQTFVQYEFSDNIPQFDNFGRLLEGQRFNHTTYTEPPKPEFQAIRLRDEDNDEMAIAFLHYSRRQIMGRTSWTRMKVGSEKHRKVDESLISIPDRVDAVYYDDLMYIFNQSKFEKVFDYLAEYERCADEVIDAIDDTDIPFHDFGMFKDAVYGNNRVLRLMYKVHERGTYEDLDSDDAKYIRDNFDTDVKFEENDEGEMAVKMDDKRDVWAVLRFFNDDHLDSPLTDEQYISLSKQDAG